MDALGALGGKPIIIKGTASRDAVLAAFASVATEESRAFRKAAFEGRMMDPGDWIEAVNADWLDDPSRVLAVCTRRPGVQHDLVAIDMAGSIGLVIFVDGEPYMGMGSAGRREANAVAKKTAKLAG